MRLNRVEIKNFRSIRDITLGFDPACRVLVGINESGKSNILKALAFLDDEYLPSRKEDLREALPDESPISESYVRFVFSFEKQDTDTLIKDVSTRVLAADTNPEIVVLNGSPVTVAGYCATKQEGLYVVDILREDKSYKRWIDSAQILPGWKKPTKLCPSDFKVTVAAVDTLLTAFKLIRSMDFPEIPSEYLENATVDDFANLCGSFITGIVKENVPEAIFWEYDEGNLLPNSVAIQEFSDDPDTCIPLQNMFILAGYSDIAKSIEKARAGSDNQFQNFLNGISKKTTNHFRNVWKEYDKVEFALRLDADSIIPGVKEQNTLDFSKRSDGFKRFVTFLLLISVNVKTDSLTDTLLLIDEPEIGLHPSGARYLRDELIKISKTNFVVYSTHSIFMIDSGEIERHVIVKKDNEITTIEQVKVSNISDEEVLYNALGHSIFSVLKETNVIFEGWKDKRLFQVYLVGAPSTIKRKFQDVGITHAKGVASIKTITPMIELANRTCIIISDGDNAAKQAQRQHHAEGGFGEWKTYQDVDSTIVAITGEDFVKSEFIAQQVDACLLGASMPNFTKSLLPDRNKLLALKQWLVSNSMSKEQAEQKVAEVKDAIFENLESSHIESSYKKLANGILP